MRLANGMVRRRNIARGLTTGKRVRLVPRLPPVALLGERRAAPPGTRLTGTFASSMMQKGGDRDWRRSHKWNYTRLVLIWARQCFTWLASIRAERSSFANGVRERNCWRTRPTYASK
jgi:hypothetical protein